MNKKNLYKKYINRYWNYYKSNRSLLLIIIAIAALLAITVQATVYTPEGTNVEVQFEDEGINITFANVTKSGNTSVDTSSTGPDIPDGYDLVGEYRNITTTAKYIGNISVCIDYSDTKMVDESALKLFHYETGENESMVYVQTVYCVDSTWDLSSATHPSLLYYDFDEGEGDENLHVVINGQSYTINGSNDNLLYNTSLYKNANNDLLIAWLSEQYLVIDNGDDWNISKVLTDENEDDTHLIEVGESLDLPEGFAITPLEIDDDGTNTRISITQNGDEVYNLTINENELFVYKKDLNASSTEDNWVLKFNVETVFKGEYGNEIVKINKTQLISTDVVTIRTPDSDLIPGYNITSPNSGMKLQIKLNQTSDTIQLYKGSTVSFLDNSFHFRINEDGNSGGFVAKRSELGTHEIFTQVQFNIGEGDTTWDFASATHPGILYYDFDEGMGDENLHFVINGSNYEIRGTNNFLYNTTIYPYEGDPFIAWLGEPYLVIENGSDWYISKVLINEDMDDTHLIGIDKNLSLPEGFVIIPLEFDVNGEEVWISITQNGEEVDSTVIKEGEQFIYEKNLNQSGAEDNWVLRFNLESVYSDNYSIRINSTQLISPDVLIIRTPNDDMISGFEITSDMFDNTLRIVFDKPDDNITLIKGDTTSFLNNTFHFRIHEDGDLGGIHSIINVGKTWTDVTKSLDTNTNTVCGNVTTLSEFIISGQNIFDLTAPWAFISEPKEGACINGTININGTASGNNFKNYTVEWRNDTSGWTKINTLTQKGLGGESANSSPVGVTWGILAIWNTTVLKDGSYMIRLTVIDNASNTNTAIVNVIIDNTLPEVNITEPVKNTTRFVDNIVRGTVTDTNIQSAELIVSNDTHTLGSYDLVISNNMFTRRVEYSPDQNNTINLIGTDKAGNSNNTSITVMVENNTFVQTEPEVNRSETVTVNATGKIDTQIEFISNVNRTNVNFILTAITNKTVMDELNSSAFNESGEKAVGKMVEINVEGLNATNVSEVESVIVKIYYNTSDLDLDGDGTIETGESDEDNLFIWYNSTSGNWTKLLKNNPDWVIDNGQIKISGSDPGYVWVKVQHLSKFALTALPIASSEDTNGNGGNGGGSSSGGGGTSGEARENILITETEREYVYKDVDVCYSYDLEGNIVQYINFKGLTNAGRVSAKVEILKDTSTLVDSTPPNKVYKNLNIFIGNSGWATSSNIADPTISFTVEKSWITNEKIDKSSIKMYRYSSGKWNELSTSYISEDADCRYFKSETPGFSPFAIAGEQVSSVKTDTDEDNGVISPTDGDKDTTDQMPSDEQTGLPGFCVLTGLLVIMMMAWLLRKK